MTDETIEDNQEPAVAPDKSEHYFALAKGTKLFEFEIESVLGHGGFGITYQATDTLLQETVAIKEFFPNALALRVSDATVRAKSDADQQDFQAGLRAFLDEARLIARIHHPNIFQVRRFFQLHNTGYIVLSYEKGQTLSKRLSGHPIGKSELRTILFGLFDGLEAIHERAILHRDVKPSNVILRADGTPVLIDFGAARDFTGRHSRSVTAIAAPGYSPPEQYGVGGRQGPWTDLYALGATAYRCATGKVPPDSLRRLRKDPIVSASKAAAGKYDAAILWAIDWMLTVDEAERPASVKHLRQALQQRDRILHQDGESDATKTIALPKIKKARERKSLVAAIGTRFRGGLRTKFRAASAALLACSRLLSRAVATSVNVVGKLLLALKAGAVNIARALFVVAPTRIFAFTRAQWRPAGVAISVIAVILLAGFGVKKSEDIKSYTCIRLALLCGDRDVPLAEKQSVPASKPQMQAARGRTTEAPATGPTPDEIIWNILKVSKDVGELQSFLTKFPANIHRAEAEQQIATLNAAAQAERDRLEKERLAQEAAERQRLEKERLAREEAERQRLEKERLAREQADKERQAQAERERIVREQAERDRLASAKAAHSDETNKASAQQNDNSEKSQADGDAKTKTAMLSPPEAPVPMPPAEPKGNKPMGQNQFDGSWSITWTGVTHCSFKSGTYVIKIQDGVLIGKQSGKVSTSGTAQWVSTARTGGRVNYAGTFRDDLASGRFQNEGGCRGTFVARRVTGSASENPHSSEPAESENVNSNGPKVFLQEPPKGIGVLHLGEIAYIDDNSCLTGQIKEMTGGAFRKGIPRKFRCVSRSSMPTSTQREKVVSRPPATNEPSSNDNKADKRRGETTPRSSAVGHSGGMCRWGSFTACLEYQRSIGWPNASRFCGKKCS